MKDLLSSKTFWGAVAQVGSLTANAFGVPITESMILAAAGMGLTIYGRIVAKDEIGTVAGISVRKNQ